MRIIILPAFNGDCILVEFQLSHYEADPKGLVSFLYRVS